MISIQTYPIIEKAVYQGVATGVNKLLQDVASFKDPEKVVDVISAGVMSELCDILDFGTQPIRFSAELQKHLWELARQEAAKEQPKKEEAK
jgi:hypothetical protein